MRPFRLGVMALCYFMVFGAVFPDAQQHVAALDGGSCTSLIQTVTEAIKSVCNASGINTACYAYNSVQAKTSSNDQLPFTVTGDTLDLSKIISLTTSPADAIKGSMGVVLLKIQANLPDSSQGITGVLFGDTTLVSDVRSDAGQVATVPIKTIDADPVLLRTAASSNNPAAGRLTAGQDAVADGRTNDSNWIRIRAGKVLGWAFSQQVSIKGDINTLAVLDAKDTLAYYNYTEPLQAFILSTGTKPTCTDASSGLLLQSSDKAIARLLVNGVDLSFATSTVLLRVTSTGMLEVDVLGGSVTVTAQSSDVVLNVGDAIQVQLGGKTDLMAAAVVKAKTSYSINKVQNIPIGSLPAASVCMVGLSAQDKSLAAHSGPGEKEYTTLYYLKPDQVYIPAGWANDAAGLAWWKITGMGKADGWVAKSAVHSVGNCYLVGQVTPTTITVSKGAGDPSTNNGKGLAMQPTDDSSFVPKVKTIYNVVPTLDRMEGTCSGALNYCPLLVAITPQGDGILYRGQELKTYSLSRIKPNVYGYVGRNSLNDSKLVLTVVFTSPTNFNATEVVTADTAPDCKHNYNFNGTAR